MDNDRAVKILNDFLGILKKRHEVFYREADLEIEMKNYDKAYALKIRADEVNRIVVDLEGYMR